uniref:Uncharacterized protein n=1 Tax=Meloidogyne floridensis TaxID=298350 RepID=A0A915NFT0_9BILA
MLLNYLQNKLGIDAGTKKYAECIHLISTTFIGTKNFDLLITYHGAFYKSSSEGFTTPNSLKNILLI